MRYTQSFLWGQCLPERCGQCASLAPQHCSSWEWDRFVKSLKGGRGFRRLHSEPNRRCCVHSLWYCWCWNVRSLHLDFMYTQSKIWVWTIRPNELFVIIFLVDRFLSEEAEMKLYITINVITLVHEWMTWRSTCTSYFVQSESVRAAHNHTCGVVKPVRLLRFSLNARRAEMSDSRLHCNRNGIWDNAELAFVDPVTV